jgi:hypothetical protein
MLEIYQFQEINDIIETMINNYIVLDFIPHPHPLPEGIPHALHHLSLGPTGIIGKYEFLISKLLHNV